MVNVNPVNTRPQSDTPEIRKYKKRFNSEILCAALWGKSKEKHISSRGVWKTDEKLLTLRCTTLAVVHLKNDWQIDRIKNIPCLPYFSYLYRTDDVFLQVVARKVFTTRWQRNTGRSCTLHSICSVFMIVGVVLKVYVCV